MSLIRRFSFSSRAIVVPRPFAHPAYRLVMRAQNSANSPGRRGGLVWCGRTPCDSGVKQNVTVTSNGSSARHLAVEPGVGARPQAVGPAQAGAQLLHAEPLQPARPRRRAGGPRSGTTGRCRAPACSRRSGRARASACRPRAPGPCRSAGSTTSPRPRGGASWPARPAAGRAGCTSGCAARGRAAARPCGAGRTPAPPRRRTWKRRPRTPRPAGSVTARISASLSGHSSIIQWFQSSGKPCTATTSTQSSTPLLVHVGDEVGVDRRDAAEHADGGAGLGGDRRARRPAPSRAKALQSGSSSKSQCDLLFGSFQSIAASITASSPPAAARRPRRMPGRAGPAALRVPADVHLVLRVARGSRTRRCAASPRCRPGSGPTSSSGRPRSGARRSAAAGRRGRRKRAALGERVVGVEVASTRALPRCSDWSTSRSRATCSCSRSSASSGWRRW